MALQKQKIDGLYVSHLLNCECYIQTSVGVFIQDILITGRHEFQVYSFNVDHVPSSLARFGVTNPKLAHSVKGWFQYALRKGYVSHFEDLFPQSAITKDFTRDGRREELLSDVQVLQTQVAALDATFSLDSERVAAITNLQNQITSNDSDIAQEISDRQAAITAEQSARTAAIEVEKVRAEAEEKSIQDDVNANEAAADQDRADIRSEFAAVDLTATNDRADIRSEFAAVDLSATNDRVLIRSQFTQADSDIVAGASSSGDTLQKLETRVAVQEATYTDQNVDDAISSATDALVNGAPGQLATLDALAQAIGDDVAHVSSITALIAEKSDKIAPVFSGSHAVFQGGLEFSNSATCQGQHFVGNNSITVRSIGDADVTLSAPGSGVVICDSDFQVAGVCKQNGYSCLDTNSSCTALADVTAVGSGSIISVSERSDIAAAKAKLGDRTQAQIGFLDATSAIQAQIDAKEPTLSVARAAVCDGEVYSVAEKAKVAAAETKIGDRTQAQLARVDATSSIQAQLDGKEPTLSVARAAVCDGEVYSTAEKAKVTAAESVLGDRTQAQLARVDATSGIQAQLDGKLSSTGGIVSGDILLKKTDGSPCDLELSRRDHTDMDHTFKLSVSYLNINQEGLQISANGQPFVWYDERQRVAIGNNNPAHTFDVTGDGRFTSNLNVEGNLTVSASQIDFGNLPTSDPGVAGQLYQASGFVKISE